MTAIIPLAARGVLRQAFNGLRWAPLLPLLIVESDLPAAGRLERIATFLLCCAAPQIVGYLLEMEHSGRLDQMRLAGRTPRQVALRLIAIAGGPWIAAGVLLLGWSAAIGERFNHPMVIIALVGAPTAIAALFTTGVFAKERIDPRVLIAGLGLVGALFGGMGMRPFWSAGGNVALPATFVAIGEAAIIAACLRGSMRRIAYPPASGAGTGTAFHYRPDFLKRAPAMYRGAVLAASGYVLAVVFPPAIAIVRAIVSDPDAISITPFLLPPLVIGFIVISLICREDAVLGRLDVVRQSAMTPSTTAVQMIAGLWMPFVLTSVSLAIIASTMFTIEPLELALVVAGLLIVGPLPMVEGWSRFSVLTFSLPYVVAVLAHVRAGAWISASTLIALLWFAAVRRMRDSDAVVTNKWAAALVAAVLGAWPWTASELLVGVVALAAGLLAASPLLVPARFSRRSDFWISHAAIGAAAVAAAMPSLGLRDAVAAGVTTGLIWLIAVRVRQSTVVPSLEQALIRVACIIFIAGFSEMVVLGQVATYRNWTRAALALLLLIIIESGLRARAFVTRPVTPRA